MQSHHYPQQFNLRFTITDIAIALLTPVVLIVVNCARATAQIIPDDSLGNERSIVTPDVEIKGSPGDRIDGGAIRDSNLFHSFEQFNIGNLQRVYFTNPAGITNIFSRVTGNNLSEIFGTLGVLKDTAPHINGDANLFFINPNGIIFGENASLDVGGSFAASTADAIQFGDRGFFDATDPETPPLLTIKPSAFFFNQINPGRIENRSTAPTGIEQLETPLSGLRVADGKSLLLVGGDITIDAGGLHAPNGQIELAAAAANGTIGLNFDGNNLSLSFPEDIERADISLANEAFVNTSGDGGGAIQVWGEQVKLSDGSQIAATTLGAKSGRGLTVNASESVELTGTTGDKLLSSGLFTQTGGTGNAGDLTITTKDLRVENGARVLTGTFSQGNAGALTVNASESVQMTGGTGFTPFGPSFSSRMGSDTGRFFGSRLRLSPLVVQTSVTGKGENVTIQTRQLELLDGAQIGASVRGDGDGGDLTVNASEAVRLIGVDLADGTPSGLFTQTRGKGNAGDITIDTRSLSIINSQSGSFSSGEGNAGNLTVRASDSVEVRGKVASNNIESPALLAAQVETTGKGSGGNLKIETGRLSVSSGGVVQVATFGQGDAGNLSISASEVEVFDTPLDNLFPTGIFAGVEIDPDQTIILPEGEGGDLTIESERLSVRNGAEVSVSTAGIGNAGELQIQASESVEVVGTSPNGNFNSQISAEVKPDGIGNGGSLSIETGQMIVRDGAEVSVSSLGSGIAGNLDIKNRSLNLDNQGSITATTKSGDGGNITLKGQDLLLLRRGSQISTTAGTAESGGDGGDINITADLIVSFPQENSDITANAFAGDGGNITIDTQNIFGFREDPNLSNITASSQFGLDGTVSIDTSGIEPGRELIELPIEIVDVSQLINQNLCIADGEGEFIITGKGGLSPSPQDTLNTDAGWEDWRVFDNVVDNSELNQRRSSPNNSAARSRDLSNIETQHRNSNEIVEAQSWFMAPNGNIVLSAQPVKSVSKSSTFRPFSCRS